MEDEKNILIATGGSRYYKDNTGLSLDVGTFTHALEVCFSGTYLLKTDTEQYATGKKAIIAGKPSPDFFKIGLELLGKSASETGNSYV